MRMTPHDTASSHAAASRSGWSELLGAPYRATSLVLAGGVLLHALNIFLTSSLLPTAVGELGREELYAWNTTVFVVASVISSTGVSRLLARRGALGAYLVAIAPFLLGAVISAVAPSMEILLVGRGLQGVGGGLLAGLGLAVISSALPSRLWSRATGLVSAMWGIGTLVGPVLGGTFSQLGQWRGAFALVAAMSVALAVIAPRALPREESRAHTGRLPIISLTLLAAAAMLVSVAAILESRAATSALILAGVLALGLLVVRERRARDTILPRATYTARSPLTWVYLTLMVLAAGTAVEAFAPLFGQRLGGLEPFWAGFLGAAISVGWSTANVLSPGVDSPRAQRVLILAGPAVLAGGLLAAALLQRADAGIGTVLLWAAAMAVAGTGIGMAFPHLLVIAMSGAGTEEGAAKAAAGANTVELSAVALASAISGVLVNLGETTLDSARLLFIGLAAIAALGLLTAGRAVARSRRGSTSVADADGPAREPVADA